MKCHCGRILSKAAVDHVLEGKKITCKGCLKTFKIGLVDVSIPPSPLSLPVARAAFYNGLDKGVICPCCDRLGKRYRVKLSSDIARSLIWLVRSFEEALVKDDWVHRRAMPKFLLGSNKLSKLAYWGLAYEKLSGPDTNSKNSGWWKPTQEGIDFAYGKSKVKKRHVIYARRLEKLEGDLITIKDALGDKFDYKELMGWS